MIDVINILSPMILKFMSKCFFILSIIGVILLSTTLIESNFIGWSIAQWLASFIFIFCSAFIYCFFTAIYIPIIAFMIWGGLWFNVLIHNSLCKKELKTVFICNIGTVVMIVVCLVWTGCIWSSGF